MDQRQRCLQKTNFARDLTKSIKCDKELKFINIKPVLFPEYNLYKIPATKSYFQTKFEAFKEKVYVDKTEDELKTSDNYLQNLSAARKRTYLDFKYIPAQAGIPEVQEQFIIGSNNLDKGKLKALKDKNNSITKAIINSILGIIKLPTEAQAAPAPAQPEKTKEKEKLKFALNVLNYENEVLRGNINNRLNQKEYKISTTAKKTERNFEGYIDNESNVYADKGFLKLTEDEKLKTKLQELVTTIQTNIPAGQPNIPQAKQEPEEEKIQKYLDGLKAGSHKRNLLTEFFF